MPHHHNIPHPHHHNDNRLNVGAGPKVQVPDTIGHLLSITRQLHGSNIILMVMVMMMMIMMMMMMMMMMMRMMMMRMSSLSNVSYSTLFQVPPRGASTEF